MNLRDYLGDNSYHAITNKIFESVKNCEPSTLRGKEIVSQLFESLGTSITPMHEIKTFQTNAEVVSKEDVNLSELLSYIKKEQTGGDFNYLINLCKEEHFANQKRNGINAPQETLKDIENLFNEPSNVVIEAIKNDMFSEKLNSTLYSELRNDFSIAPETGFKKSVNKIRKLNESLLLNENGLLKYNPVAIRFATPDRNYYITPETIISKLDGKWQKDDIELPVAFNALSVALKNLPYSYDSDEFMLSDEWDFKMCIDSNGACQLINTDDTRNEVDKSDLQDLFAESISFASVEANRAKLIQEADRFVLLANNYTKLVNIDEISVLRKGDEFAMLNESLDFPVVIDSSTNGPKKYPSFDGMITDLSESLNENNLGNIPIFKDRLLFENNLITEKHSQIQRINENQANLESCVVATNKILDRAEPGSLIHEKAKQELVKINESTNLNIQKLKQLNDQELYEY